MISLLQGHSFGVAELLQGSAGRVWLYPLHSSHLSTGAYVESRQGSWSKQEYDQLVKDMKSRVSNRF